MRMALAGAIFLPRPTEPPTPLRGPYGHTCHREA